LILGHDIIGISEIGKMTNQRVKENISIMMVLPMMEIGMRISNTGRALKNGQMERDTRVPMSWERRKVRANSFGLMVLSKF
jgi:hypothetical protein